MTIREPLTLVGGEAERLAARWAGRTDGPVDADAHVLHGELLAATFDVPSGPTIRRPSMCHDGTPITYSAALDGGGATPLRMLVEPGGCAIGVPEQLEGTLTLLRRLLDEREWTDARTHLDRICGAVLPAHLGMTKRWWGGAWLGLVAEPYAPTQLRAYLNLRWGSAQARWQRAIDAICGAAGPELTPTLDGLLQTCAPVGVPVGVGLAFAAGDLRALRLYVGVHEPEQTGLAALLTPELRDQFDAAAEFDALAAERLGPRTPQSVTAGYDFLLANGTVLPGIPRCKLDVSCQALDDAGREAAGALAREHATRLGHDPAELDRFEDDLAHAFGGSTLEFLSLGVRRDRIGMSAYVKPHGLAIDDR